MPPYSGCSGVLCESQRCQVGNGALDLKQEVSPNKGEEKTPVNGSMGRDSWVRVPQGHGEADREPVWLERHQDPP